MVFHSSSRISEKCRENKEAVVNMRERVAQRMKENWSERLKDEKSAEQGISGEVREAEKKKRERKRAKAKKGRAMCVLVSSSFLIGQPELISPALGSSGQDWVGYCQKHNPPPLPFLCILE